MTCRDSLLSQLTRWVCLIAVIGGVSLAVPAGARAQDSSLRTERLFNFTTGKALRDKSGKLIDKAVKKSTWEGEAKPFDFDHAILQYVVPSIAQVRIVLEGRLD